MDNNTLDIQNLHDSISDYKGSADVSNSELGLLASHFRALESEAVPQIDQSLKGQQKGRACRPFNAKNIAVWEQSRRLGAAIVGKVRCTYAHIAIPTPDSSLLNLFTLQASMFAGDYLIQDCGVAEVDPELTEAVFGAPAPCDSRDCFDAGKPHVGKLTDAAFEHIKQYCAITTPYVIYYPRRWSWRFVAQPAPGIQPPTPTPSTKRKWLFPIVAGALAYLFD